MRVWGSRGPGVETNIVLGVTLLGWISVVAGLRACVEAHINPELAFRLIRRRWCGPPEMLHNLVPQGDPFNKPTLLLVVNLYSPGDLEYRLPILALIRKTKRTK